ncbi:hypothetical protein BU24DRAFT_139957 [Aaosphaeria arxii CBS 175.79]|uniref:Uncharacterized protein n=1 Tax=Aaosphaeria arxii CBS 175.79 TaxID=1450172 RepID=A0A6A5XVB3_9PLEO|nr:uncharacterized protein BU24DRAFT_139957 [Aaosphaeria arxii CBS 175.79]KAF2016873.1 hypothetical protein BU24DRAFT_139957 [Aaosphaeria arxii CBS 175.79]
MPSIFWLSISYLVYRTFHKERICCVFVVIVHLSFVSPLPVTRRIETCAEFSTESSNSENRKFARVINHKRVAANRLTRIIIEMTLLVVQAMGLDDSALWPMRRTGMKRWPNATDCIYCTYIRSTYGILRSVFDTLNVMQKQNSIIGYTYTHMYLSAILELGHGGVQKHSSIQPHIPIHAFYQCNLLSHLHPVNCPINLYRNLARNP